MKGAKFNIRYALLRTKRLLNFAAVQLQFRLAKKVVWGHPYVMIVDTINSCNLKCPLCPTGLNMPGRPKGRMKLDAFKRITDELGDYALALVLYNWGEPLLNKDIFAMIEYATERHIKTILSSNLNLLDEEMARRMVGSGLDKIIVSLDGASDETYRQYRIGGDFDAVIKNLKLLLKTRDEMESATPKVVWQFLVFKHNEKEVDDARKMAEQIGVDETDVFTGYLGGPGQTPYVGDKNTPELLDKWLCSDSKFSGQFDYFANPDYLSNRKCYFLWQTITINWDGSVAPCCCVFDQSTDFGNITQQSFKEIWNNEKFRSARNLFGRNANGQNVPNTICRTCKVFRKSQQKTK